ncbi:hypothetical protein F1D05_10135 [Kribbella qitaiheensis]|uniref:Uncharacterized protein n=1 Tax=Kribbella qitaiheensis TaxID=1544730 RepID=A0A7G6WW23_9ACTN|nr:hypothetical protein [Kribbella qitaiheensis]QNE18188.1 hypothetical protein F1D05_10135 [Kribbella qitaiheensis]
MPPAEQLQIYLVQTSAPLLDQGSDGHYLRSALCCGFRQFHASPLYFRYSARRRATGEGRSRR